MSRMLRTRVLAVTFFLFIASTAILTVPSFSQQMSSDSNSAEGLIQPEELVKVLQSPHGPRPLVLQVGVKVLFVHGHIPGAEYVGPGSSPEGIEKLRKRVANLPRDTFIVLYCGCCPWSHCPNIRPAGAELQKMGFTNTKLLYLPTSFQHDWIEKGYPATHE